MRALALLLLLACSDHVAGDPCDCAAERGHLVVDVGDVELVCQRIRNEVSDGGVSFPSCETGNCCQWEAP